MYSSTHLKEELTDLFWKVPWIWYSLFPNKDRFDRVCWTFCSWLTLTLYIKDSLEDKSMLFTNFYLMQGKNRNLACISSKQVPNTLAWNPQNLCQQIDKKNTLEWNKLLNMFFFFISAATKIAVIVSWRTAPVPLC